MTAVTQVLTGLGLVSAVVAPLVVHAVWCAWLKAGCGPHRREWWQL